MFDKAIKILGYIGKALENHQEKYPNTGEVTYKVSIGKGIGFETPVIGQFQDIYNLCTSLKFEKHISDFIITVNAKSISVYLEC